jgi:hypothetical protein
MNHPPVSLRPLHHRDELGKWLNDHGLTGAGVEVGTQHANYAATILRTWAGRLTCIDPWIKQAREVYHDGANLFDQEQVFREAMAKLGGHPRCKVLRTFSEDAAPCCEDRSLDFVYLDGNHAVDYARADVRAWFPKVKIGGIFSGHDFYIRYDNDTNSDAQTAVMEFAEKVNQWPQITWCNSWWFVKTEEMQTLYGHSLA